MVWLPVTWLAIKSGFNKRRTRTSKLSRFHVSFSVTLWETKGSQGQPKKKKTGKGSKGKLLNLKKSLKCINPIQFRIQWSIYPENSFIELYEKELMLSSKMIPNVLQQLRKQEKEWVFCWWWPGLAWVFFAFLVLDEEDMPSSVLLGDEPAYHAYQGRRSI